LSAPSRVARTSKTKRKGIGGHALSVIGNCVLLLVLLCNFVQAANPNPRLEDYEGRLIVSIELAFENAPADSASQAEFMSLLKVASGTEFSMVRVRDSLQALFDSGRIANARVEVVEEGANKTGPIRLKFIVQRQVQIGDVRIEQAQLQERRFPPTSYVRASTSYNPALDFPIN